MNVVLALAIALALAWLMSHLFTLLLSAVASFAVKRSEKSTEHVQILGRSAPFRTRAIDAIRSIK